MLRTDIKRLHKGYLKTFGASQPGIGNYVANQLAEGYAKLLRDQYLSGQVLDTVTGTTRGSVKFYKLRKGVFAVRPGVGVPGSLNYLYIHERGGEIRPKKKPALAFMGAFDWVYARRVVMPRRPFMTPSFRKFRAEARETSARIYVAMEEKIHKETPA